MSERFSSLRDAWDFFDEDGRQQIYEPEFRRVLLNKLHFDGEKFDIGQLYKDLDYDGNGFLSLDDWMFLKKWVTSSDLRALEALRVVLRKRNFRAAEAFKEVFDTNQNGSIDPKEFVDGFKKLRIKHMNPRRLFELLDADGSGEITVSEFIKLFSAESRDASSGGGGGGGNKQVNAIAEHDPLPAIERDIEQKYGLKLDLKEIQQPIKKVGSRLTVLATSLRLRVSRT